MVCRCYRTDPGGSVRPATIGSTICQLVQRVGQALSLERDAPELGFRRPQPVLGLRTPAVQVLDRPTLAFDGGARATLTRLGRRELAAQLGRVGLGLRRLGGRRRTGRPTLEHSEPGAGEGRRRPDGPGESTGAEELPGLRVDRGCLEGPGDRLGRRRRGAAAARSEEHTSELQSPDHLVCRLLLEKTNSRERASARREASQCSTPAKYKKKNQ